MIAYYPAQFSREQGCTELEWLRWLPGAVRGCVWEWQSQSQPQSATVPIASTTPTGQGHAVVQIGAGQLHLRWQVLAPRRIAQISLPRMAIDFDFDPAIEEAERQRFMRYFDLYMQRGGG